MIPIIVLFIVIPALAAIATLVWIVIDSSKDDKK